MLEAGLIISRFAHFAAVLILFGLALFPLYAYPDRTEQTPARMDTWLRRAVLCAALIALLSALPWLAFTTGNMAGSMSAAADWDAVQSVLRDMAFGHVWLARAALLLAIVALAALGIARRPAVVALLSALALASLAMVGHTQQTEDAAGIVHTGADALHLLAAGAWIGGLIALAYVLARSSEGTAPVLMRFSGMGYVAVALLIASGLVNSWYLVGTLEALARTPYGQLLVVKLCLFAGMLALALANRFWLVPSLVRDGEAHQRSTLARLRRHVIAEEALGLIIVLVVSVMGTMEPAIGHAQS